MPTVPTYSPISTPGLSYSDVYAAVSNLETRVSALVSDSPNLTQSPATNVPADAPGQGSILPATNAPAPGNFWARMFGELAGAYGNNTQTGAIQTAAVIPLSIIGGALIVIALVFLLLPRTAQATTQRVIKEGLST